MLNLVRKVDQEIMIGDDISVMVTKVRGDRVTIGIRAPRDMPVHRREVYEAIQRQKIASPDGSTQGQGSPTSIDAQE